VDGSVDFKAILDHCSVDNMLKTQLELSFPVETYFE